MSSTFNRSPYGGLVTIIPFCGASVHCDNDLTSKLIYFPTAACFMLRWAIAMALGDMSAPYIVHSTSRSAESSL